jgi:hypothetical protein
MVWGIAARHLHVSSDMQAMAQHHWRAGLPGLKKMRIIGPNVAA